MAGRRLAALAAFAFAGALGDLGASAGFSTSGDASSPPSGLAAAAVSARVHMKSAALVEEQDRLFQSLVEHIEALEADRDAALQRNADLSAQVERLSQSELVRRLVGTPFFKARGDGLDSGEMRYVALDSVVVACSLGAVVAAIVGLCIGYHFVDDYPQSREAPRPGVGR